ncbi:class I SAM-dependent methyltransferase [Alkalihalobacillus sp. AL-G]|uniref:class I SAM-dependent DNA methyltransferase n=1 Tax=Alkalihalobacillus sp. AL-G TaxID=2926399 RepID=UPI00272AB3E6|nr:class I SAM-dependent methyltransferase [Alkalihalobacillus sp. AL-G]WLD92150.1 class I SAM-dependent methyltransferase [Alkalihalobacillus sp. AL-G]
MNYQQFAVLYDRLMEDAPYDMWMSFFTNVIGSENVETVLDVGCGTGEISVRLAREGFNVTGVDLSEEMLTIARQKADTKGLSIPFFQQDMRELYGFPEQDAVIIFCDSLNYLRAHEDVDTTFRSIHHLLKDDGLLLFDVHSLHKMNETFGEEVYTLNSNDISYIWECHPGTEDGSVHHDLTFFVNVEEDLYKRYEENHYQRTYSIPTYEALLTNNGFEVLTITSDFSDREPTQDSERLFFVARKVKKVF